MKQTHYKIKQEIAEHKPKTMTGAGFVEQFLAKA